MAHRIDSYNKAVVFTDQPIPQGSMFQVKLLDKGGGWAGSIVSPCTCFSFVGEWVAWIGVAKTLKVYVMTHE